MFVYFTDASGNSVLLNNTQYSISGIGNANGGTVTYPLSGSPIAAGTSLTMIRILAYQQLTDLINQGGYYPDVVEAALDYLTMLTQQLTEAQNRALSLAVESDGSISVILPVPQANYLIGWNSGANGLTNISPGSLAGLVSYGNWSSATFSGDGTTTDFILSSDPLVAANIDVSVGAAVQRVGIDYTYIGANTVRFSVAPPVGTNNVFMRWGSSLPLGVATSVAGQTTIGTSLIQAVNAAAAIAILGAVDISSAQTITGLKTFSVAPIMPTADVRQTVLQGAINSGGYANMLSAGTGLALNLAATVVPMITSFAQGVLSFMSTLSADTASVVPTLAANNLSFITQDYASPTSVTWGKTLAPPQYGYTYNQAAQALLHFNGTAGSTAFLDDFGNTWTAQGSAKVQTNQAKFGGAALGGGGTSNALAAGDYVKSVSFTSLGNGGWALRGWCYPTALPVSAGFATLMAATNANGVGALLGIYNNSGTIKFAYNLSSNGSTNDIASLVQGTTTPVTNTWYWVELTYDAVASVYRLNVGTTTNASQESSTTSTSKICPVTALTVGNTQNIGNQFTGYIDEAEFLPYCDHPGGTAYAVPSAAPSLANAGYASDFFSIPNMTMYQVSGASTAAGANPTFTAVKRVYVGECATGASSVSSVVNYALKGRYFSGRFPIAASTGYAKAHNIGTEPKQIKLQGATTGGGALYDFANFFNSVFYGAAVSSLSKNSIMVFTQANPNVWTAAASSVAAVEADLFVGRGW